MTWFFTGVGPHNKGAELMLLAMLEAVRERDPEARIAIAPGSGPYDWRARYGLYQLFDPDKAGRLGWMRKRLLHQEYRRQYGLVLPGEVDVVLDAAGYALGDVWQAKWMQATADQFEGYRGLGAKVILLPQALGPFERLVVRDASRRILEAADLVFARDAESLSHAQALVPGHPTLQQAPDFTNLLSGRMPADWKPNPRHVAFVPNRKMLPDPDRIEGTYVDVMARAMRAVADAGYSPFMLVHEQNDPPLAAAIAERAGLPRHVFEYAEPLQTKGILGACAFSVGSRFHGLINALSQGVPCIGTFWSHKYSHLFRDYEAEAWLVSMEDEGAGMIERLGHLLDDGTRAEVAERLTTRSRQLKAEVRDMWDIVDRTLGLA